MRKLILIFLMVQTGLHSQSLRNNPNFNLIWNEEFDNGNTINTARWMISNTINTPEISGGPNSTIYRYNSSDNVTQSNGSLRLKTTFSGNQLKKSSIQCTIPQIQGGFYEANLKFKNGPQSFPSFWIWSGSGICNAGSWGDYQEIDFLEYFGGGYFSSGGVHYCECTCPETNLNCQTDCFDISKNRSCRNECNANMPYTIESPENFNIYSGSWQSTGGIKLYQNWATKSKRNTPLPMLTNNNSKILVLSTQERCWNANECLSDISNYPYWMDVDFIRIFTLKSDCTQVISSITDFNTFNYSVKKSISIANQTIPIGITSLNGIDRKISLYATDFIELGNNIVISSGGQFELGILSCQ